MFFCFLFFNFNANLQTYCLTNTINMKTSTFTKRIVSVLFVIVLMVQNFATAQNTEFPTRSKKTDYKEARQDKKMMPKM